MDASDDLQGLAVRYAPGDPAAAGRWAALFDGPADVPVLLVNRFVLRETARYPDGRETSGAEAFAAYAAVSTPALARVGGRFLATARPAGALFGEPAGADLCVVAWYPGREALLALLCDPAYAEAFAHRRAALAVDEVSVLDALAL